MVKFLVVRFSSIGDIVLTTPVLRHLREQVNEAEIHYLTKKEYASILEANPNVDQVKTLKESMPATIRDLRKEQYDYIIDLHHNTRTAMLKAGLRRMDFTVRKLNREKWLLVNLGINRLPDLHMVDRNLETISLFIDSYDERGLEYYIPPGQDVAIDSLPEVFRTGYVGLAIGAQHGTKKLPLDQLINLCSKIDQPVILLGGPGDHEIAKAIEEALPQKAIYNACGNYSLHQSASLVRQSRVLLSHDTGLMHIGAAFGKKIISIWGNTIPGFGMYPYRPHPDSVSFEVSDLRCRPCSKIGSESCPKKHFRCMMEQDLDGIASKTKELYHSS
jgi:ADP-heptose:LPS heptosyltransferase